jgi:hypothetical protein
MAERRKKLRFKPLRKVFAVFLPDFSPVGEVIDIGMEGFSIQYLDSEYHQNSSNEVYWLFTEDGFFIDRVWVKVISDTKLMKQGNKITQKNLQFIQLTEEMKDQLDYIIRNYTVFKELRD